MNVLGLDIGGANLKAADPDGTTAEVPFAMWQRHHELAEALSQLAADFLPPDLIGLTMTAELADCFALKSDGVRHVIHAVQQAFPGVPLRVWMTSGEFAEPEDAAELPELVAAANWHALAVWCGRAVPEGPAVLMDMGSTTTDLIPLLDGIPVSVGRSDFQRLKSGELLYSGAARTPVSALVRDVQLSGGKCRVAAEHFATIADALVVAQVIPPQSQLTATPDGRPLSRDGCIQRLARMACCDVTEISIADIEKIAQGAVDAQRAALGECLQQVLTNLEAELQSECRTLDSELPTLIISGSGTPVLEHFISTAHYTQWKDCIVLARIAGPHIAGAACAYAVACLAHDLCRDDLLPVSDWSE